MPFLSPRRSPQSSPTLPPAGTGPLTSDFRTWPGLDDLSLSASPLHVQLLVETTALAGDVQPHDVLECLLHPMVPDDTLGGVVDRLFGACRVELNGLCR